MDSMDTLEMTHSAYRLHYPHDEIPREVFEQLEARYTYYEDIHHAWITPPVPSPRLESAVARVFFL